MRGTHKATQVGAERPWESSALSKEERRAAMAGAMGAAMLLAGVFIAAGALAILAMQLLWNENENR